jgi:hypothetical protein
VSLLGQKRTCAVQNVMSALCHKADVGYADQRPYLAALCSNIARSWEASESA